MTAGADSAAEIVLHIGADKTGTTSIQQLLRHNRAALLERGILYPRSPGRVRHVELDLYARSDDNLVQHRDWLRGDYPPPMVFRRRLRRRLAREVGASGASTVLLSDEALFRMKTEAIVRVRGLLDGLGQVTRLVVYLRRQDDHLASYYQQAVKVGEVLPLRQWVRERSFRNMYDYRRRLGMWQDGLRPDTVVVRPFEVSRFPRGSLTQDFLDAAGVDARAADLSPVEVRNERLSAEAVELLRILNLHRIENEDQQPWQVSNRVHIGPLREAAIGPQLTLPDADLDRFMEQWSESNRWVAGELLGEQELFHEPRRSSGATTEQRLDPDRLDHLLPLLQVPERDHAEIRAIAEREARA